MHWTLSLPPKCGVRVTLDKRPKGKGPCFTSGTRHGTQTMRPTVRPFYPPPPPRPQMLPYTVLKGTIGHTERKKVETRISDHWESNSEPAPAQKVAHPTVLILAALIEQ